MEAMVLHSTTKILTLVYSRHCEWQFLEEVHLLLRADQSGGVSPRFIFSFPMSLSLCPSCIPFAFVFVSPMYIRMFACACACASPLCPCLCCIVDAGSCCCCVCFSLPTNYNMWQGWTWTMVWGTAIMRMEWTLKRPAFANPAPFLRCQSYLRPLKSN